MLLVYYLQDFTGSIDAGLYLAVQTDDLGLLDHFLIEDNYLNVFDLSLHKLLKLLVFGDLQVGYQLFNMYLILYWLTISSYLGCVQSKLKGSLFRIDGTEKEPWQGTIDYSSFQYFFCNRLIVSTLQLFSCAVRNQILRQVFQGSNAFLVHGHSIPNIIIIAYSFKINLQVQPLFVSKFINGLIVRQSVKNKNHHQIAYYLGTSIKSFLVDYLMAHHAPASSASSSGTKSGYGKVLKDFMLGGTSGAIAKTIAAPIERVKLLLQTQMNNPKLAARPYTGILDCFSRCAKEEGVISLWRGNWANVVRYFPTQAINFATKDFLYSIFLKGVDPKVDRFQYFSMSLLSGGIAGSFSLIFVYPLDFARTRLGADIGKAANERQFNGLVDCCAKIFKQDGIKGLYQGFAVSVLGIFTYRAFYFGGYDSGKRFIWGTDEEQKHAPFLMRFLFAQVVTSSSETLAYPLDTIRRRLMMESGKAADQRMYKGTLDCGNKILKTEGVTGFFKGNLSNFWRSIGSSLVLVLYDELQKWMTQQGY